MKVVGKQDILIFHSELGRFALGTLLMVFSLYIDACIFVIDCIGFCEALTEAN
jgi:hypothetical protein